MKLNPSKCKVLCISNERSPILFQYTYDGHAIQWTDVVRYLRVTIDTHLDWKQQCKSVVTKATRIFNVVRRTMFGCSNGAKSRAFCALVLPLLEYASPVWCPYSKWSQFSNVAPVGFATVGMIH